MSISRSSDNSFIINYRFFRQKKFLIYNSLNNWTWNKFVTQRPTSKEDETDHLCFWLLNQTGPSCLVCNGLSPRTTSHCWLSHNPAPRPPALADIGHLLTQLLWPTSKEDEAYLGAFCDQMFVHLHLKARETYHWSILFWDRIEDIERTNLNFDL